VSIDAGQHGASAWRTIGRGVELGQEKTLFGQGVERGCFDLAAKHAQIRIAEVIGHDEQNIRPRDLCGHRADREQNAQ
jgi:hypothetical protein